jgi:hypothetical protein
VLEQLCGLVFVHVLVSICRWISFSDAKAIGEDGERKLGCSGCDYSLAELNARTLDVPSAELPMASRATPGPEKSALV